MLDCAASLDPLSVIASLADSLLSDAALLASDSVDAELSAPSEDCSLDNDDNSDADDESSDTPVVSLDCDDDSSVAPDDSELLCSVDPAASVVPDPSSPEPSYVDDAGYKEKIIEKFTI